MHLLIHIQQIFLVSGQRIIYYYALLFQKYANIIINSMIYIGKASGWLRTIFQKICGPHTRVSPPKCAWEQHE